LRIGPERPIHKFFIIPAPTSCPETRPSIEKVRPTDKTKGRAAREMGGRVFKATPTAPQTGRLAKLPMTRQISALNGRSRPGRPDDISRPLGRFAVAPKGGSEAGH